MPSTRGTPNTDGAVRLVLLGSGELAREVAIEAERLGCEVVAGDRYPGAPAMQVADRAAVIDMTDPSALRDLLLAPAAGDAPRYKGLEAALVGSPDVDVRIFGKPDARANRRMGVALATAADADTARAIARAAAAQIDVLVG